MQQADLSTRFEFYECEVVTCLYNWKAVFSDQGTKVENDQMIGKKEE